MPVRYPFTDAPTLVPFPALFLGPGPKVILIASLIVTIIGILLIIRPQRHRSRTMIKWAIALGFVSALISAYYAISLAVLPHRIIFPGRVIGVEGAESGFALIGAGLVVAFVGGVIDVMGGAMVIKGERLKTRVGSDFLYA
ncbi:MAG: hypothetical protein M3346_10535 [Actinomycetota bacterium]|nr:hypothetical protein [Actinomycetota bacterium]